MRKIKKIIYRWIQALVNLETPKRLLEIVKLERYEKYCEHERDRMRRCSSFGDYISKVPSRQGMFYSSH